MTNSEQALREIAEKHFPCVGTRNDREYRKMEQDALVSSLTALISERYYPKEFTEWVAKMIDIGDLWESQIEKGWILLPDPKGVQKRFKTTDELYQYYKENKQ